MKISNKIYVYKTDKHYDEILNYCKRELVLDNEEYIKKERLGLWVGKTPKKINYYEMNESTIILPYGCIDYIKANKLFDKYELDVADLQDIEWNYDLKLYDYQQQCSNAMVKARHGIFVSPAGSGKTQCFIDIILKLKKKALIIVHTQDLLNQAKQRIEGLTDIRVGTISQGKVNIADITIATVQTLCNIDLSQYAYEWGTIVCDEVHRVFGSPTKISMFYKVLSNLKCINKIGCTATFHRASGNVKVINFLLGDIAYEVQREAVADKTIKAEVRVVDTGYSLDFDSGAYNTDGTINFSKMISCIAGSLERNKMIAQHIKSNGSESCLVLSDRLEQLREIRNMVGYGVMIDGGMTSKKAKAEREKAIDDMRTGKQKVLYGSYNLCKEGLDIPRLEAAFLCTPKKDYAVIVQCVGRIERKFSNKINPTVYDFVDSKIGITLNMYKKRKSIYKKNGNNIKESL